MTIDEAIAQEKEMARTFETKDFAEYHKQLVELLEELKAYREIGTVEGYKSAIECYTEEYTIRKSNKQYNKAIDDFANVCEEDILCQSFGLHANGIERIAEQLKAGGENE